MDDETRAIIKWLESPEGRCWSRATHRQSQYATRWFGLKPDLEGRGTDLMEDVVTIDLGRYSDNGIRFYRKPIPPYVSYYRRYQSNGSLASSLTSPENVIPAIRRAIFARPASAVSDPLTWLQFNPHTGQGFF